MSDIMLHGVLNMPPKLWCDSPIDVMQRHSRYVQASQYIDELDAKLTAAREVIAILKSKYADHHSEAERITSEIRAVTAQRDEWKANHDNQVSINKLLRDRPDLKDRAASVDKLIEQRDSLQAQLEEAIEIKNMATETLSAIREKYGLGPRNVMKELKHKVSELDKVLKDCLYAMPCSYVPNHTVANLPSMIASQAQMLGEECNRADALEQQIEKLQQEIVEVKSQYRLSSVCRELTEQRDEARLQAQHYRDAFYKDCDPYLFSWE